MKTKISRPILGKISPFVTRTFTDATSAALLGIGLSRRRKPASNSIAWLAAGLAVGGTAALFLAPAGSRERLIRLFQRTGGGVGKRVGELVGQQVGAHPVATAKVVEGASGLLQPRDSR
jgi:hypothetical protein